jgi:hypothetical protein
MANVIQHLAAVSTGYKVFEDNQVLTKEPLNALVDYLDDHQRLTRVALLGVGIACGLRISTSNNVVVLSKGVGVTTDGDLIRVPADLTYTRFQAYDQTAPKYDPFYNGQTMLDVFELVGDDVATAATLDTFNGDTGKKLQDMVAILLMESFLKDQDLCTGGDCDNKGKDALSNVKLLLMDPNDVGALRENLATLDIASRQLTPTFADRVVLNTTVNSVALLAKAYRTAANATRERLNTALAKLFPACGAILTDLFAQDPAPGWTAKLDANVPDASIQSYYDFLSDLVDTYNELGETIAGDIDVCCPPLAAFPKHLLLGVVGAGSLGAQANRTAFYPSPLVRASGDAFDRARFLVRRIDTLIGSFTPAFNLAAITVTPSRSDEHDLGDRAIPAYYTVDMNAAWPIHRAWSYALERRGMAHLNYSANATAYGANGANANPLSARIAAFPFMRVEGHLGKSVTKAAGDIQDAIAKSNLPFTVRAVLIGDTRPKIVIKPPIRYGDLHRLHQLVRNDLTLHLDDVMAHSARFKADVDLAVQGNVFDDRAAGDDLSVKGFAEETRQKVEASAKSAQARLAKPYSQYKAEPWHNDVKETVSQAANMRLRLGDVSRTELVSPVDSLVANKHMLWAEWLDNIIAAKDDQEDDKLLFTNFIKQHPAADHRSGVERGGTFVLVYNGDGIVVGDVSLPYYWPEAAEAEPEQSPLPPPKSRPPLVIDKGWRLQKPVNRLITDNVAVTLDNFRKLEIDPIRSQTFDFQKNYVQALKDSVQIMVGTPTKDFTGGFGTPPTFFDDPGFAIKDPRLRIQVRDTMAKAERVQQVRKLLIDPALDPAKRSQLEQVLKVADHELGESLKETSKVVTTGAFDAKTEGAAAAAVMTNAFAHLTGVTAGGVAKTMRSQANAAGVAADTKAIMGAVLKGSGLKM